MIMTETLLNRVPTSGIRIGDIVSAHGMRVRIDNIRIYDDHPGSGPYPTYACHGTVLNLDETLAAGIVPPSFLHDAERDNLGPGHGREDYWNIQGNDLATWTILRPASPGQTGKPS
jgi:hypothetical protein